MKKLYLRPPVTFGIFSKKSIEVWRLKSLLSVVFHIMRQEWFIKHKISTSVLPLCFFGVENFLKKFSLLGIKSHPHWRVLVRKEVEAFSL